jgi:CDP-glycerol glycerophosphotransferase
MIKNLLIRVKNSLVFKVKRLTAITVAKILGIDAKKVVFISMMGNSYGCNPKAISDYIKSRDDGWTVVWAFNGYAYGKYSSFEKNACEFGTYRYFYHLYTAKFIISNARLYPYMLPAKQKGQVYIQTWHGTALKRIEADVEDSIDREYVDVSKRDSKFIDYIISESAYMTNIYMNKFWYNGRVVELGSARNDVLVNRLASAKHKVYKALNLPQRTKLLLYAPTFRNGISLTDHFKLYDIDFQMFLSSLRKKIPGNWQLVIRFHPNIITEDNYAQISARYPGCVNASTYPDMQELLAATDILVTDYSSSIFDFMYTYRPCFMYTKDKEVYDRGFYMPIESLPFYEIKSNADIENVVNSFDENEYRGRVSDFIKKIGGNADGATCERIYDFLLNN